ncbi:AMP-binding protein [Geodermatophilus ruber]|uniref:Fatty-acyl-CoA synthase n=1 Tax=Geodermatophilus ruber TaxID=504800 RepID=A0A1I4GW42_9ACTN|nr:AMP-binding protein [Geodermatophilus ruber]SFL33577.1 fatty-acyl-CoA synthase [Geodermatophilus ruber]
MEENLATILETVADAMGDAVAVVQGDRVRTWAELDDRAARLAAALSERGVRAGSRVGVGLWSSAEYVETVFAVCKLGAVPFNVNYRYRAAELLHVLTDSGAAGLVFDATTGAVVAEATGQQPTVRALLRVGPAGDADPVGEDLEAVLAASPSLPRTTRPDGEWLLYTGGTTGRPKGVLSRQSAVFSVSCVPNGFAKFGIPAPRTLGELAERVRESRAEPDRLVLFTPTPLMHGTGIYSTLGVLVAGGRVVFPTSRSFDPDELAAAVARHRVTDVVIVGDVFARPLVTALDAAAAAGRPHDLSSLRRVVSVGAVFSAESKAALLRHADVDITDVVVASEGGPYAMSLTRRGEVAPTSRFVLAPGARLLDEEGRDVEPGSGRVGVLAAPAPAEVHYSGDAAASSATFRDVDGVRYSVPGDLATLEDDGTLVFRGRGSRVVNTGGEKVQPEEVEEVILRHPAVRDAVVVGVPDERFGQRITAVVALAAGARLTVEDVRAAVGAELADYKRPREVVFVPEVRRSPVGKADLSWAGRVARGEG